MHRHTHSHTIGQIKRVFGWWREREFNEWFCAHNSFGVKLNEDGFIVVKWVRVLEWMSLTYIVKLNLVFL